MVNCLLSDVNFLIGSAWLLLTAVVTFIMSSIYCVHSWSAVTCLLKCQPSSGYVNSHMLSKVVRFLISTVSNQPLLSAVPCLLSLLSIYALLVICLNFISSLLCLVVIGQLDPLGVRLTLIGSGSICMDLSWEKPLLGFFL